MLQVYPMVDQKKKKPSLESGLTHQNKNLTFHQSQNHDQKLQRKLLQPKLQKLKLRRQKTRKKREGEQEVGFLERQDTTVIQKVPFNLVSWKISTKESRPKAKFD